MGNPNNRTLDSTSFVASYPENRASVGATTTTTSSEPGTQDTCTRRKRVRFAQGKACLLESESGAKARLSDVDNPKTSEYAFFKKQRKDAGKPGVSVQKKRNNTDGCKSGYGSGVGNRISQCFQNLKFSLHTQDVKPMDSSLLLSPISGPSKATEMNYVEQLDFQNSEFTHPIKKAMHVDFNASCSPFRDRVKSAVSLLQWLAMSMGKGPFSLLSEIVTGIQAGQDNVTNFAEEDYGQITRKSSRRTKIPKKLQDFILMSGH